MSATETPVPPTQSHPHESNGQPAFVPALIIIDMQNDFVSGSLAVPGAASIIDNINSLLDLPWRVRVATRDFHPDNHVSFAHTHGRPLLSKVVIYHPEDTKRASGIEQVMWPVHCVAHTNGADFVDGLDSKKFDVTVSKGTHSHIESYSAFMDIWGRNTTELPLILEELRVTDVFLVGLAGDYCVKYTAADAVQFGYKTWLLTDAVKSISNEEVALQEVSKKGVLLTTCREVIQRLGNGV
ncbi:pyrazinamidase/nicotinamidase [Pholiota conissans]|uniref:nicotinamidase n=1 Tax=Pholiota conissans TaxID=109636 RepID=A0A9P6D7C0_9AGAR|nr:pyrazinamidase/nicotinamidase [Pholiota conissans]